MSAPDPVVEAARAARPYLADLLGEDAHAFDDELAALLNEPVPSPEDIEALVVRRPEIHAWIAALVGDPELRPPDVCDRGPGELPGLGEPVAAPRYACQHGDFVWYRRTIGAEPPPCPTHGPCVRLEPLVF
jgi:hypothetical protein